MGILENLMGIGQAQAQAPIDPRFEYFERAYREGKRPVLNPDDIDAFLQWKDSKTAQGQMLDPHQMSPSQLQERGLAPPATFNSRFGDWPK